MRYPLLKNAVHSIALLSVTLAGGAHALDIQVLALTSDKAVLAIGGGKPRTMKVGQISPDGVKLISADTRAAVIEFAGKRQTLVMGESLSLAQPAGSGSTTLYADSGGHFFATATVNGSSTIRFLVDTGASMVSLGNGEAKRAGLDYTKGERVVLMTANGATTAYKIKLNSVKVGGITLTNVDALVAEGDGLNMGLLGMSFLNRLEMKRDGDTMTLTRRY